jgi:hypothetical protein
VLIAKLLFCSTLAFGSLLVLRWLQGRAGEERILRALVIAITIVKLPIVLLVYHLAPNIVQGSDALLFYYPQVSERAPGTAAVSRLRLELLAALHVRARAVRRVVAIGRRDRDRDARIRDCDARGLSASREGARVRAPLAHRVPLCILADVRVLDRAHRLQRLDARVLRGARLCARGSTPRCPCRARARPRHADDESADGAVLAARFRSFHRRLWRWGLAAVGVCCFVGFAVTRALGLDFLAPVRHEAFRESSGNVWFLLSTELPQAAREGGVWQWAPIVCYAFAFGALGSWMFGRRVPEERRFDATMAFALVCCLLFLVLSRKSHLFYLAMMALFILHTASLGARERIARGI